MPPPTLASFDISTTNRGRLSIVCSGNWTLPFISSVNINLRELSISSDSHITIDTTSVESFDMSGAWLLANLGSRIGSSGSFAHTDINSRRINLVNVVDRMSLHRERSPTDTPSDIPLSIIDNFGARLRRFGSGIYADLLLTFHILGESLSGIFGRSVRGRRVRVTSIIHQLDLIGIRAIPVIAVMSFLIGGVIAQQGAFLLKVYGEELLTINLVGILLLREIGVLLTAIMISGRTGSAITAELGTMKMREEKWSMPS